MKTIYQYIIIIVSSITSGLSWYLLFVDVFTSVKVILFGIPFIFTFILSSIMRWWDVKSQTIFLLFTNIIFIVEYFIASENRIVFLVLTKYGYLGHILLILFVTSILIHLQLYNGGRKLNNWIVNKRYKKTFNIQ